jgi:membrane protease YdiL (CAAX protease family)
MAATAVMFAAILSYTWLFEPRVPRAFVVVPGAVVLAIALGRALRSGEWGLDPGALLPALRETSLVTLPALALLLAAGAAAGTLHDPRVPPLRFAALLLWGGAQQWALQTVVLRDAQRATSRRFGVLLAALLFALVHLPNPFLAGATLLAALAWCAIYDRHPNLLPLALAHALATLAILSAFGEGLTGRLRIGAAYLRLRQ